jgi:hypothetical protein
MNVQATAALLSEVGLHLPGYDFMLTDGQPQKAVRSRGAFP